MTVVLDCNVIVSAARIDGTCRAVVDNVVRNHDIVLSEPVLAEYKSVAARPKHAAYRDDLKAMIGDIERVAASPATSSTRRRHWAYRSCRYRPRSSAHPRQRPIPDAGSAAFVMFHHGRHQRRPVRRHIGMRTGKPSACAQAGAAALRAGDVRALCAV